MELAFAKPAMTALSAKVKPIAFVIRKHLPDILMGTGVASIAAGAVLACKASPKAKELWDDEIVEILVNDEETGGMVPREVTDKDRRDHAIENAIAIAKLYAPGVGLLAGGTAMLVSAKNIEHSRFTAVLGAYSSLEAMFEEYRGRVIAEAGPAVDRKCMSGATVEKVSYTAEDPETGKNKKAKEEVVVFTGGENPYHRIFDEYNCPSTWQDNMEQNRFFLECQQKYLNMELQLQGRVFLNDVYKRLGFDYCEVGQFVGWLADDVEGCKDGFIDFGIDYGYLKEEIEQAQLEGRKPEPSIWLNFNCDGEVWDKPLAKKREDI